MYWIDVHACASSVYERVQPLGALGSAGKRVLRLPGITMQTEERKKLVNDDDGEKNLSFLPTNFLAVQVLMEGRNPFRGLQGALGRFTIRLVDSWAQVVSANLQLGLYSLFAQCRTLRTVLIEAHFMFKVSSLID